MDISLFLEKVDFARIGYTPGNTQLLGDQIIFPSHQDWENQLSEVDCALIGVNDDRMSVGNRGCAMAPDAIRKYLYTFYPVNKNLVIADLGNIPQGNEVSDTYFALRSIVTDLIRHKVIPIILGGGQDLTFPIFLAYESLGIIINLVAIDPRFDNQPADNIPDSQSYLSAILTRKPSYLFNFTNLGYQSYYVNPEEVKLLNELYFDTLRLGELRTDLREAEPMIRNADFLTFDISAIRQSDAPGHAFASPNGLFGEEACQLMRYAGITERLSCIGFFEMNPLYDNHGQTAQLVAQMIWYFFEGISLRINDYPSEQNTNFIKYIVSPPESKHEMIFYKSKLSDRWWMQLPISQEKSDALGRHVMVPCSYNDYLTAIKNDIPDRWWKAYQKLI